MTIRHVARLACGAALCVAAATACRDATGVDEPDPPDVPELPVLGHGVVHERYSAELAVRGAWAYTTTWANRNGVPGNALKIWQLTGAAPVLHDSVIIPDATTLGDVQISDDGALLVVATEHSPHGSLLIFDRADPAAPQLLARHHTDNTRTGVHTVKLGRVNGVLYAFLSVNPSPAQLVVLELSDPASPIEVLVLPFTNTIIHDVFVRDGWLFAALWHAGLAIYDIGAESGSPAQPRQVGSIMTVGGSVHNAWWFHDPVTGSRRYVFVGEESMQGFVLGAASAGDVHVVDVSDMAHPQEVAFFAMAGAGAHNFSMDEQSGILYAAFYNGGVRALDVRGDLGACAADARAPDGRCDLGRMGREVGRALASRPASGEQRAIWGVAFQGPHLFATDMLNGLFKLDAAALAR